MRRSLLAAMLLGATLAHAQSVLTMSTTTSTDNSGLLGALLPQFEAQTGIKVRVIAVGSGKALELGRHGDVDVVLVHARAAEDQFVAEGHGVNRRDVMYNDFVLVGPAADPAAIKGAPELLEALRRIVQRKASFVSRGDNSGTELMELSYWKVAGVKPSGKQYIAAGQGMGEVLTMADQLQAYTLSDRATFAAYRQKSALAVLYQGDARMFNPYGVIAVNPVRHPGVHHAEAMRWIEWLTSSKGQAAIAAFKVDGQQLFFPSAK
jgi:tungstate transport system substrate-binding protein